jgi:uncharacterized membrane protein
MNSSLRSEGAHVACVAALFVAAALAWPHAPESMPVHWNLAGEVDRYGGRAEGLLAVPLIALGLYALLLWLPRIDPRRENYEKFAATYLTLRWSITLFLAVLYAILLTSTFRPGFDATFAASAAVGGLLAFMGNLFGKLRPNWFVGIRTPWTLSSRESWAKTHRAGGWLFIASGGLIALTGYTRSPACLIASLALLLGGTLGLVVYSYVVWSRDPDRASCNMPSDSPPV